MLYVLTQHSLFNREFHPYLICKCKRGKSIGRKCVKLTHEEYSTLWRNSEKKFNHELVKKVGKVDCDLLNDEEFIDFMKKHRIWCDKTNLGVTHFGLHYDTLNITKLRFDILYLKLSITRQIIGYIRFVLEKYSSWNLKQDFLRYCVHHGATSIVIAMKLINSLMYYTVNI